MVKKSFFLLYRVAYIALSVFILALLLSVLVLRYLVLPQINSYKSEIAQSVSKTIGQKTTIGRIEAGWDGLNPHLHLHTVTVFDHQHRAALTLPLVETSISWLSVPFLEPRLSELTVHQPQLTIRRDENGQLTVAGIAIDSRKKSGFPNWLLRQSEIAVLDAAVLWQDDLRRAPPLFLKQLNFRMQSPAWGQLIGQHRFALRAVPSAGSTQPIDLRGKIYGRDSRKLEQWRGTLYGRLEATDLAVWRNWVDYPINLYQGVGATRFWLDFVKGKPEFITSDVFLDDVKIGLTNKTTDINLKKLSGRLIWTKLKDGQQLQAERLTLNSSEHLDLKNGRFILGERIVSGKTQYEGNVQLDELQLETLRAFAVHLPLPETVKTKLAVLEPVGKLKKLSMIWKGDRFLPQQYRLHSQFSGLGMNADEKIPGLSEFTGSIEANERGGTLHLNSRMATLDLQKVFRWPVALDKLDGKVQWRVQSQETRFTVENMVIANQNLSASLTGSYIHKASKDGVLDFSGKLDQLDGRFAYLYLPLTLRPKSMEWLDNAIAAGDFKDISFIVKGKPEAFPWINNQQGFLQIKGKIHEGEINYNEHWPKLTHYSTDMLVQGDRLELNANQGLILGNKLNKATIIIPHLKTLQKQVFISADINSPADALLNLVKNSPLAADDSSFIEKMQAGGNGKLTLDLLIPLGIEGAHTKVKGSYLADNVRYSSSADSPMIEGISGKLDFTDTSLRGKGLSAQIFGSGMQFDLANVNDSQLRVSARGKFSGNALRKVVAMPLMNRLQGSVDWTCEFMMGKYQTDFTIKSSLVGFASALPPPFNKKSEDVLPLSIMKTSLNPQQETISLALGQVMNARFFRNRQEGSMRIERGEISLGESAEIPATTGIHLKGKMANLDVDQWQALFGDSKSALTQLPLNSIQLEAGSLDLFGRRINDLKLDARAIAGGWQGDLQSQEINGKASWSNQGNGKVVARLRSLSMPSAAPAKLRDADTPVLKERKYPALDIVAQTFYFRKKNLGQLELQANELNGNWHLDNMRITNPDSILTANGEWQNWKQTPVTQIQFDYAVSDIGSTMARLGYPETIKDGEANITGQLNWPGSPHAFSVQMLNGDFKLEAKKGQFLKVKSGVARFLGIISLQTLPRRLTFDFRDLFTNGVAFDQIGANVSIHHGVMRSEDFKLDSPSVLVEIKGETDLHKETQQLSIKATPHMSDTISLAALAGGPAVAGAVFLAQKLFKDPFSKLATERYEIGGTWDNPQEIKKSGKNDAEPSADSTAGK